MGKKLGKIAHFPPIQQFAAFCNGWQNEKSVGDAILCWIAGLAIFSSSIHIYSTSMNIGKMCFAAQHAYFRDGTASPSAVESW